MKGYTANGTTVELIEPPHTCPNCGTETTRADCLKCGHKFDTKRCVDCGAGFHHRDEVAGHECPDVVPVVIDADEYVDAESDQETEETVDELQEEDKDDTDDSSGGWFRRWLR